MNFKNLLNIKPKTVGDAFRSIKKMFNIASDDLAHIPGQRLYKDAQGHFVEIKSDRWGATIKKILSYGTDKKAYKEIVGTPAELSTLRTISVTDNGDSIKKCSKYLSTIAPFKKPFDPLGIITVDWLPKRDHVTHRIIPNVKVKKLSDKTQIVPYTTATTSNLKV